MSRKGKIGLSAFALMMLMVVVGIAASGAINGTTAASVKAGLAANAPSGAGSSSYVAEGIWAQAPRDKVLPNGVRVIQETKHDVSPPLRDIPPAAPIIRSAENENPNPFPIVAGGAKDPVVQRSFGVLAMPTPIISFDGITSATSGCGCLPPDTNGDVGPNNYVQTTNTSFEIWDKSGTVLQTARPINTLFSGFGGPCQTHNDGDPVVNYDSIANRWVINQFTSSAPYYQCFAVSTTGDPTGTYFRYAFLESNTDLYDYPKTAVWPDAYYMTANVFTGAGGFHPSAFAFDRLAMIAGTAATAQEFNPGNYYADLLPSDLDGPTLPPAGAPNLFISGSGNNTVLHTWRFHVDFATPANSTFTGPVDLAAAPWDPNLCNGSRNCIPQPGTTVKLDSLYDHLMYRFAYRNMGGHESSVVSESVDENSNDHAGVRWYEIRNATSSPFIYQQGTYAPDTDHRWMPSIAMDQSGNIALGYSVSSTTTNPSVRYTGRLADDPLGQMAQGEASMVAGTGHQTSTSSRWGDYSAMQVDPSDDCTFWYTQEYYSTTGNATWSTRIGKFKFPSCGGPPPPTATPGGPTSTATPLPTNTALPTPTACAQYTFTTGTDTLVPGTTNIGNSCDDCTTYITLPFTVALYEHSFTNAYVSSNGNIEFVSSDSAFGNDALPVPIFRYTVVAYWDDLITSAAAHGVFTSVSGTAPNRIFNVEWRAQVLNNGNGEANFEARFYEGSNQVDLVYAVINNGTSDYTIGVERDNGAFTQIAFGASPITAGTKYTLTQPCGLITPTTVPATATRTTVPTTVSTSTATHTVVATNTIEATITPGGPTETPTETPTACTLAFTDVDASNPFYTFVRCLVCRGIISGYTDNTFRPGNDITRGQIAKMVSKAAGFEEDPGPQIYEDVAPGSPFYDWVNRLTNRGYMGGYDCGLVPEEPCVPPGNRPYFRPSANATRGQLAKIVSNAAGLGGTPTGTFYTDVPEGHPFYLWIMRLTNLGVMSGYTCGGPGEPCDDQQRPYFRPFNNVTRGQASKIVANTFFPDCQTPSHK